MSTEALLIAAAAVLYLLDCVVLLERGQALWTRSTLSFGSNHYQVRGKAVALMNPFTPFVPLSRTLPLFSAGFGMDPSGVPRILLPLAVPAAIQFLLVFVALPWCLYRAPGTPFAAVLSLAYLNVLLMLALVAWRFRRAGIPRRALFALGFGWIACLPLSVNSMRKAGLAFEIAMDAREALKDLPAHARAQASAALSAQVAEALQDLEEDDKRHRLLADLKRELDREADHGRT
ncbi:MAG: hypothetical protein ACRET8_01950 [Burkholderiales bacterium]